MIRYRLVGYHDHTILTTVLRERVERERAHQADLDPDAIIATEDVGIIGRFGSCCIDDRVLWADGHISAAWEFNPLSSNAAPPEPPPIADVAARLLGAIYGSDVPGCDAVGGPLVVATVSECVTSVVARDPRRTQDGFQPPAIERLDVALADGTRATWYVATMGYCQEYVYALAPTCDAAVAELGCDEGDSELVPVS